MTQATDPINYSDIQKLVAGQPGLRAGYIGNFENWGDDRCIHIWVEGQAEGPYGNTVSIFSHEARMLDKKALARAKQAVRLFGFGFKSAAMIAKNALEGKTS